MFFFQNYLSKAADLEMKREHKRNIKVRAKSELDIIQNKKTKSVKEKRGMSMYVVTPKKACSDEREPFKQPTQQELSKIKEYHTNKGEAKVLYILILSHLRH